MCGINGIFYLNGLGVNGNPEDKIKEMNNSIAHRGPDSDGVFVNENVALGFRRLSIIDLSNDANQPMLSSDKSIVIVFNGEIYNYIELKNELKAKGYEFKTQSDTEVIINAYLEWGIDCVNKFNGMWSFAIYDINKKLFFASRDRLGVKPFYYSLENDYLIFSSETKAIIKVENKRAANQAKAFEYLAYGYIKSNSEETFYEAIKELLPGHRILIKDGKVKIEKYWELKPNMCKPGTKEEAYEMFSNLFENSIRIRYRSDVPIAIMLSGGLDSSVMASVTEKLINKGLLPKNNIQAYSIHFPGYVNDELDIVKRFAATCEHIKLNVCTPNIYEIATNLEQLIFDFDQPFGSFSHVIHNQVMQKIHKDGIKVVLNGQGADEAFYGYGRNIFGYFLMDRLIDSKLDFLKQLKSIHSNLGYQYKMIFSQMYKALLSKEKSSFLRAKYQEKNIECLNSDFVSNNVAHFNFNYKFSLKGNNLSNYTIEYLKNTGLNSILHYEDVSSMQASIEMRSPFVDYRLMEFAFSLPDKLKFDNGLTKKIIRETVGKDLPSYIVDNYKKTSFSSPFTEYMKIKEFKALIDETLNSESFINKTIWDHKKIKERFNDPDKYPGFPFWRFLNYELWSKVNNVSGL